MRTNYLPDTHRSMPQSAEAEQGVICSALLDPRGAMEECQERGVSADWFYNPAHQKIWDVIRAMSAANMPCDLITITQALRDQDVLDEVGGAAYVTGLFWFVATALNVGYYLEILREKYIGRQIIQVATDVGRRAFDEGEPMSALLDEAQARILAIAADASTTETIRHFREGVHEAVDQIELTYKHRGDVTGLATGFVQLDRMTGGLEGGQMIVIAGRPSMGKTALGVNIAEHVALRRERHKEPAPLPVAIFSLEMPFVQLCTRLLCSNANLNLQRVRDGFLPHEKMVDLARVAGRLSEAPIYIDDTASLSIQQFRARARRAVRKMGVKLIVIDYLQLMKSASKRAAENRVLELTEISGGIKLAARELNVPIIALAQLNRDAEKRTGSRPQMADLRECGAIEQDADMVGLIYRPEYYAKDDDTRSELAGKAELILAKQRNGPVGPIALTFLKEFSRFENPAGQDLYSNDPEHRQQS